MLVAAHKPADTPHDPVYLPIHVGRAIHGVDFGFTSDATGQNISSKNDTYCELTAVYWAWKNLDPQVPAVGLSHYRRYFRGGADGPSGARVLSGEEMTTLLSSFDVVVARRRNYVVENVESHYRHGHIGSDLDAVRSVLRQHHPEYSTSFESVMHRRSLSLYNMFLMRRVVFDEYSAWLFDVLESAELHIDNDGRDAYQRRTFGYLAERLLNVWLEHNSATLKVIRRPVVNTDGEPKLRKAVRMIRRKVGV